MYNYYIVGMSDLRVYLIDLGIKPEIADMYIALRTYGGQTISELSRTSGVPRITVYRLLDELKATGLVEFETRYKRSILNPAPIKNIGYLLAQKRSELKKLQHQFGDIAATYAQANAQRSNPTRVQFYEGIEGLRQMAWNQTKGKGENLSILYDSMQHKHEKNFNFFENWVRECNQRGIQFRGIVGEHFIQSQQEWYATHANERLKNWQSRYMSERDFTIPYSMVIYDDVVLYYNWNDEQMAGVEIHNPAVASLQRQLFEMLWERAEPVDDITGLSPA